MRGPHEPSGGVLPSLIVECDREPVEEPRRARARAARRSRAEPRGWCCARAARSRRSTPAAARSASTCCRASRTARLVELTRSETSSPLAAERAERLLAALGKHVAWVGDAPGLVLGRIVCQVINESAFAFGEGVGDAADIDTGMKLGLSHPRGPLEWADAIGIDHVLGGARRALPTSTARSATGRRRRCGGMVAAGRTGRAAGAGFFDY